MASDRLSDTFRTNVRAALHIYRISQGELARRMGRTHDDVSKLLCNPRDVGVTAATIERVATALGVEAWQLMKPGEMESRRSRRLERVA